MTGSLIKSGGVGGLLQITDQGTGKTYLPTYDGNGNVVALLNGSTGVLAASYEYDPFGILLRNQGLDATVSDQPFKFSTKFMDQETGLYYYGSRYYSAGLGRFINRDPTEEAGGINLYGFCANNGVNACDRLGMGPFWFNGAPEPYWDQAEYDMNCKSRDMYCNPHDAGNLSELYGFSSAPMEEWITLSSGPQPDPVRGPPPPPDASATIVLVNTKTGVSQTVTISKRRPGCHVVAG